MPADPAPIEISSAPGPEDQARANFYALLSRLFYAAPDKDLLDAIARNREIDVVGENVALGAAWRALQQASAGADIAATQQEYDDLFIGTGKAAVTLFTSHYLTAAGREKVLVRLRDELDDLGLARRSGAREPEDHVAGLFDVMRFLIVAESMDHALQKQQRFFQHYVASCYGDLCDAITLAHGGNYYRQVARFAKAFLDVEAQALAMI